MDRLRSWEWKKLGLQGTALVYNTMVLPVLLFIAQLENPPAHVLAAEEWGLRRVAPGPYGWIFPLDLWRLRAGFGLSFHFRSLSCVAQASQAARVATLEAESSEGLHITRRQCDLTEACSTSSHLVRMVHFRCWSETSFVPVLAATPHKPE